MPKWSKAQCSPNCFIQMYEGKADSEIDESLDNEAQRKLFEEAVRGTDEDVNNYIVRNTRLISSAIKNFLAARRSASYLFDDMFSVGLLALTRSVKSAVNKVRDFTDEELQEILDQWGKEGDAISIPPYLYVAIYRDIREVYERDSSEPLTTRRRKASRNHNGTLTKKVSVGEYRYKLAQDHSLTSTEVFQEILSIAKTPQERLLLKLRLIHNDEEVSKIMGITRLKASKMRKDLHQRLCKDYEYDQRFRTYPKNTTRPRRCTQ